MKKATLALMALLPMVASAQESIDERMYNDSTEYFMEPTMIVDTTKVVAVATAHRERLQLKADSLNALAETLNTIISNPKVKLTNDLLAAYSKAYTDLKANYDTLPQGRYANRYGSYVKDYEKVEKMMDKGKTAPDFILSLKRYVELDCQKVAQDIQSTLSSDDFTLYFLMELKAIPVSQRQYPQKEIQVPKKNPNYRPAIFMDTRDSSFNNDRLDEVNKKMQSRGWEWLDKEHGKEMKESYPIAYSYTKYDSHPEYKVCWESTRECVFDSEGKLVRIARFLYGNYGDVRDIISILNVLEYRKDYEANKYDIQKEDKDVQYVLKNKLGYSDESANKQFAELGKTMNHEIAADLATTKTERKQQMQKGKASADKWLAEVLKMHNPIANNFLKQLEKDHEADYKYIYQIKRLDDVSFRIEFVTYEMKPKCDVYVSYYTTEPYSCDYSIDRIIKY